MHRERGRLIYLALVLLVSLSCLDFQFESEYEDINGISLEYLGHYTYGGQKLLFHGDTGYVIRNDSLQIFDFANVDNIYLLDAYVPLRGHVITDFVLEDNYAFVTLPIGLHIIDMNTTQPQLAGTLGIQYPNIIEKRGDYLYIAAFNNLIITDASEITNPVQVGGFSFEQSITELEVDSNFAYVMTGQDIQILNIGNPEMPSLVNSLAFIDTLPYPRTFLKKGKYLYVSARYSVPDSTFLITYDLSDNRTLTKVSQMQSPHLLRYMDSSTPYMLALSNSAVFLLNHEFPSNPCIGEMASPGGDYGIIRDQYIFALDLWYLNIFEITQTE